MSYLSKSIASAHRPWGRARGRHRRAWDLPSWPSAVRGLTTRAPTADARPPLAARERVLASESVAGISLVATTLAIYHRVDSAAWSRLGWEETGRLVWDARRGRLDLTGLASGGGLRVSLPRGTRMVALVRERVASTLLASSRVRLTDELAALVLARRRPGSAEVVWVVAFDGDADPDDPEVQARVESAIRELRRHLGL